MKTLAAMIRKQKITINLQKQELHILLQRRAESERNLQDWRSRCLETERYLELQVTAGHEIALDRFQLARLHHSEYRDRCAEIELQFKQWAAEVVQKEKVIVYAEKTLEKFSELFVQRKLEGRSATQRVEWQMMDEWAVNAQRQRA